MKFSDRTKISRILFIAHLSYSIIAVGANLFAVIGFNLLTSVFLTKKEMDYMNSGTDSAGILNILSFIIPISYMIYYFYPIEKMMYHEKKEIQNKGKAKILNAPIVVGAISFLGWAFGVLSANIIYLISGTEIESTFRFQQILSSVFLANFCFVFSYYSLDFLNRKYFIPELFQDEKISNIPNTIRLSIFLKFLIFYMAVALTPFMMLLNIILSILSRNGMSGFILPVIVVLFIVITFGIFLTYLISSSFEKPILSMKIAAGWISEGNYDIQLKDVSNDELGNLEDAINEMASGLKEKEFIKDTFGKHVDPGIRDHLLKGNVGLGGELVEASILFVDIRGFTTLSEKLDPDKVVKLLNLYFERASESITSENGFVNKFIGDGILAIFGAPIPLENSSLSAVRAGLKLRDTIQTINEEAVAMDLPEIQVGIGIHTGMVLAGNIGSKYRMEYTVIGDTVNIASRIESLCKECGKDFLITRLVSERLYDLIPTNYLDKFKIRGKEEHSEVYWL